MTGQLLVTVVVPTINAERTLASCLTSIRNQTHPRLEIVVVDAQSTDRTTEIAHRLADAVLTMPPGVTAQRNAGWRHGSGEIVAFIDADMVAEPEVLAEAVAALCAEDGPGGLIVPEHAFGTGFFASCRVIEKRIYLGDPSVEAARIFTRAVLESVGGFNERIRAFEDWDLTDRVAAAGHRIDRVAAAVWHDEGTVRLGRQFRKKSRYGRWLRAYRHGHGSGFTPVRSMRRPRLLTRLPLGRHPLRSGGLILLKAIECSGLLHGALFAGGTGRTAARGTGR